MKLTTWKKLFTTVLIIGALGIFLLLYDLILALFLMVIFIVGILALAWERFKIFPLSWFSVMTAKWRTQTPEDMERNRPSFWFKAWFIGLTFIVFLDLYALYLYPWIGIPLFFFFIINLFLMLFYLFVIKD